MRTNQLTVLFLAAAVAFISGCEQPGSAGDGRQVTEELFRSLLDAEIGKLQRLLGEERFLAGRFTEAGELFAHLSTAAALEEFLTLPAYRMLQERT